MTNEPKPFDRRRWAVAALMLVALFTAAKVRTLYPGYSDAITFGCMLVQLLLALSYYNYRR